MDVLPVNEFRNQIGEYVNQVYYASKAFTLTKGAKPVAALVPITLLERLATLEKFHEDTLAAEQLVVSGPEWDENVSPFSEQRKNIED